jgi:hypothetical protein
MSETLQLRKDLAETGLQLGCGWFGAPGDLFCAPLG